MSVAWAVYCCPANEKRLEWVSHCNRKVLGRLYSFGEKPGGLVSGHLPSQTATFFGSDSGTSTVTATTAATKVSHSLSDQQAVDESLRMAFSSLHFFCWGRGGGLLT